MPWQERLQSRREELKRSLSAAEAQERTLKVTARKAEAGAKELKDQMQRMKSTLDQVRAKCQSDVRKRDIELEKLRNHLVSLQRGKRDGTGLNLISIAPHLRETKPVPDTDSAEYSLEQETNGFLASFVKSLNADLEALTGEHRWLNYLIRRTKQELEEMMGGGSEEGSELGLAVSRHKILPPNCSTTPDYEKLAADMTELLQHCASILNNPSYVSIEEVEIRESEIIKLREGWEKMAERLREALSMMDTWRTRMLESGEAVNIEELGLGMDLGKSIAGTHFRHSSDSGVDTGSLSFVDDDNAQAEMAEQIFRHGAETESRSRNHDLSTIEDMSEVEHSFEEPEPFQPSHPSNRRMSYVPSLQPTSKHLGASPARRGISIPSPPKSILKEIGDNIPRPSPAKRPHISGSPRKVSFHDSEDELAPEPKSNHLAKAVMEAEDDDLDGEENDDSFDLDAILAQEAAKASSLTSSAASLRANITSSAPRLTVAEKLVLAAKEAKEAEEEKLVQAQAKGKRKRAGKSKASRRRSTLAPEELEELMGI